MTDADVTETEAEAEVTDAEVVDAETTETEVDEFGEDDEEMSSLDEERRTAQDAEPCGHPHANGVCWFSRIAEPCGFACKWLIDRGQDAGR